MNDLSAYLLGFSAGGSIIVCVWLYWCLRFDVMNAIKRLQEESYMNLNNSKTNDYMKKGSQNTPKTSYNNNYMKDLNTLKTNK
jgi:hypothetical protein